MSAQTTKSKKMNQVSPQESGVGTPPPEPSVEPKNEEKAVSIAGSEQPPKRIFSLGGSLSTHEPTDVHKKARHMIHVEEQERQDLIEISDNRKNILSLIRPPFSPKISGWTTDGYFASKLKKCPPGMEAVVNMGLFFISKGGKVFDGLYDPKQHLGPSKYQIFDATGVICFFAVETLQGYSSYPSGLREVELTVTGPKGGIVFQVSGTNKYAKVENDEGELGTISQYGRRHLWKPSEKHLSYTVKNIHETEICRIVRQRGKKKYNIYYPGVKKSIGEMKGPNVDASLYTAPQPDMTDVCSINLFDYDVKFDPKQKTLILGAGLLVYNNMTIPDNNFGQNKKRFKCGVIYNSVIVTLILCLIAAVLLTSLTNNARVKQCPKIQVNS